MTDLPTIADKLEAVKNLTPGCPCSRCVSRDTCRVTGHECQEFKRWVATGSTKEET